MLSSETSPDVITGPEATGPQMTAAPPSGRAVLRRKAVFLGSAGLQALGILGLTSLLYFEVLERDMLRAALANFALIVVFSLYERLDRTVKRRLKRRYGSKPPLRVQLLWGTADGASFKSGMYLFYIAVIVASAFLAADPDHTLLAHYAGYLQAMRYGILFLIAVDKFFEQLFTKDMKTA